MMPPPGVLLPVADARLRRGGPARHRIAADASMPRGIADPDGTAGLDGCRNGFARTFSHGMLPRAPELERIRAESLQTPPFVIKQEWHHVAVRKPFNFHIATRKPRRRIIVYWVPLRACGLRRPGRMAPGPAGFLEFKFQS
jgi:hypothetical protein